MLLCIRGSFTEEWEGLLTMVLSGWLRDCVCCSFCSSLVIPHGCFPNIQPRVEFAGDRSNKDECSAQEPPCSSHMAPRNVGTSIFCLSTQPAGVLILRTKTHNLKTPFPAIDPIRCIELYGPFFIGGQSTTPLRRVGPVTELLIYNSHRSCNCG